MARSSWILKAQKRAAKRIRKRRKQKREARAKAQKAASKAKHEAEERRMRDYYVKRGLGTKRDYARERAYA